MQSPADNSEVLIVGGGPAGSNTAFHLAKLGIKATVFEEHPKIGLPNHCAGHISIKSLKAADLYPLPNGIVENEFDTANFYSPFGFKFSLKLSMPVTASLNRARLDEYLAKRAQDAGATFCLDTSVKSLITSNGFVKGLTLQNNRQINTKMVVDAEGVSSRLVRQAGLQALNPKGLVYAVETEIDQVEGVEQNAVEVYFGKDYAPGFYGWLIPRKDGTAKLGLATNQGNPKDYLQNLLQKHPVASKQLAHSKIISQSYHAITLKGPIQKAYTNGFIAVGDAASQVKPTTGGGVIFSLTCSKTAAKVIKKAFDRNDFSAQTLRAYQLRCDDRLGFDMKVMLRLRRFIDALSDQKIDSMFKRVAKIGVDKALADVQEIDFQGQMLTQVLDKPQIWHAGVYLLWLYMTNRKPKKDKVCSKI